MHIVIFSSSTIISSLFFFFVLFFFSCSFFSISYSTHNISPADIRRYSWTCVSGVALFNIDLWTMAEQRQWDRRHGIGDPTTCDQVPEHLFTDNDQLQQLKDVDSRTRKLLYEQSSWQLNLVVHTRVTGLCAPCGKERRTIRTKQMV